MPRAKDALRVDDLLASVEQIQGWLADLRVAIAHLDPEIEISIPAGRLKSVWASPQIGVNCKGTSSACPPPPTVQTKCPSCFRLFVKCPQPQSESTFDPGIGGRKPRKTPK